MKSRLTRERTSRRERGGQKAISEWMLCVCVCTFHKWWPSQRSRLQNKSKLKAILQWKIPSRAEKEHMYQFFFLWVVHVSVHTQYFVLPFFSNSFYPLNTKCEKLIRFVVSVRVCVGVAAASTISTEMYRIAIESNYSNNGNYNGNNSNIINCNIIIYSIPTAAQNFCYDTEPWAIYIDVVVSLKVWEGKENSIELCFTQKLAITINNTRYFIGLICRSKAQVMHSFGKSHVTSSEPPTCKHDVYMNVLHNFILSRWWTEIRDLCNSTTMAQQEIKSNCTHYMWIMIIDAVTIIIL